MSERWDDEQIREWLEQVGARCDMATPGPWFVVPPGIKANPEGYTGANSVSTGAPTHWGTPEITGYVIEPRDALLIAHARTDLPQAAEIIRHLLARCREAERRRDETLETLSYRGNSPQHWWAKAKAYGGIVFACKPALERAGHPVGMKGPATDTIRQAVEALAEERDIARRWATRWKRMAKRLRKLIGPCHCPISMTSSSD